jgi:hypothetical protein
MKDKSHHAVMPTGIFGGESSRNEDSRTNEENGRLEQQTSPPYYAIFHYPFLQILSLSVNFSIQIKFDKCD